MFSDDCSDMSDGDEAALMQRFGSAATVFKPLILHDVCSSERPQIFVRPDRNGGIWGCAHALDSHGAASYDGFHSSAAR